MYDEKFFKDIEHEECPICMLPMPLEGELKIFEGCCGKTICRGCIHVMNIESLGRKEIDKCAFCRTPPATSMEEQIKRARKLMNKGNVDALKFLADSYCTGNNGVERDHAMANKLWLKAGELGCANAYHNLAMSYDLGICVEKDRKKAIYYWELAAMGGDIRARHNMGALEWNAGNHERACTKR